MQSGETTKASLIRAAERLFAERGLGTVTVKDITVAAGARNPSAVHYHFGNIEALIREVFAHRYELIEQARIARLAKLQKSKLPWKLETFLEAAVGPLFEACLEEDGRLYARFCIQLATDPRFDLVQLVQDVGMSSATTMRENLLHNLTGLPPQVLRTRMRQAFIISLVQTADFARLVEQGDAPPVKKAVREAVASLSGFLRGPLS
jgi:AcrR family transcriptional regulator